MSDRRPVLVVTEVDDVTADLVITALNRQKVPVARFNPADIGAALTVSARFGSGPASVAGQLRTPSRTVDLAEVRSVYWRRPVWPVFAELQHDDARFAAAQTRYGLAGTLYALDGPLWVNHPLRNAAADYKPAQLAVAQRLGLRVPPTLVTNDPDEARCFVSSYEQVIFKTLRWTPYQRDGVPVTGWADRVSATEIDERVSVVPHLFQTVVDKTGDLRVLIVGRDVFAVHIESGMLDWRKNYSNLAYCVVDLPNCVEEMLFAYLKHFGLVSGSFDFAVDKTGDLWWLELNPNGQWGWLEERTGLAMSAAFADLLTQGAAP
ncbi:ATP-grasp ribosomal peptide maturase [Streptomyces zhihengii]